MPNGTLKLYNKLNNNLLVSLDILGTFNIEDNLNDTPSNMKVKVITSNTYREEFQVNTIAYHEDTNSWWVIKSDESSYMTTGEYEHEIQLVEYLEFYAYRHLPNCAFAPETYTLEQMLLRLFDIAKVSITVVYPNFLDKDKIMPFFSFENFTVANAIKNISRSINAIPKMNINLTGFVPTLTFINRNGADNAIVNVLDTQFPIAYEKNMNSNDQFTTRSVSNITNAKSSVLVVSPLNGGYKNVVPNSIVFDNTTREQARIILPSKIDKIEYVNVIVPISLYFFDGDDTTPGYTLFYKGYYTSKEPFIEALENSGYFGVGQIFTSAQLQDAINKLPEPSEFYKVNYNQEVDKTFRVTNVATSFSVFHKKMTLLNKFEFDTISKIVSGNSVVDQDKKDRTIHWLPNSNEIIMPKSFRNSLTQDDDHNIEYYLLGNSTSGTQSIYLVTDVFDFNETNKTVIFNEDIMVQVGYYPIADIKVSIDNDNDAQDEKFFNQSGKVIDAVSVSKLITSHTNDSVEGTKIRNARYDKFPYQLFTGSITFFTSPPTSPSNGNYWFKTDTNELYERISGSWVLVPSTFGTTTPVDGNQSLFRFVNTATQQLFISQLTILPLGQLVRDNNQLYVITQRSIDGMVKNSNEYYNVIYTLSRNRVARSENIVADSSVISYKTPDDNLVFRSQLYKDYIELSLQNITPKDAPYIINMGFALVFSNTLAGTNFDFTVLAKNSFGTTPTVVRYVKSPTTFDLHKAKLTNVNWQDNNVLGFRLTRPTGAFVNTIIQTPIVYTDDLGKATNFQVLFLDKSDVSQANIAYNENPSNALLKDPLIPFSDLTKVPTSFYDGDVYGSNRFTVSIEEPTYAKDPFEIPVFEYMIQGNDDYNQLGNIVIGNDLFSTFTGTIRYHYVINNTTRFTAENAIKLQLANAWSSANDRRTTINRTNNTQFDLDLYSNFGTLTRNTSSITNVGVYAVQGGTGVVKFLFAINDYAPVSGGINDNSNIRVFINNWKI
jgi:hypothetical protein